MNNNILGTEKIGKLFIKLAIPSVVAQIINLLYNIVDRIFIGHIPDVGKEALTGVGVCLPIITLISAFSALCGMGGAPKAAIKMGEGKKEEANKILGNSFTLTIILAIVLTIIFEIFGYDLLMAFGASENTITYGSHYLKVYTIGTIFVMISLGLNMFITTQGYSNISMRNVIIGAVSNIILDPIFIYLFKMGVKGAALATIISQAISSVFVLKFLFGSKTLLKIKVNNLKLKASVILPCIALGVSPFVMQATESILSICFNTSLQKYGQDLAVGTMTILTSLMQLAMLPLHGFTQGAQPIISYNYGAKQYDRVKKTFIIQLIVCFSYSFIFWLMVMVLPKPLIMMFTNNKELIDYTTWAIRIYMAFLGIFGVQIACQQTFVSLGNAIISLILALLRKVILLIPLIYILPTFINNKCMAVFLAEPVADLIAVTTTITVFLIYFKKKFGKQMKEV